MDDAISREAVLKQIGKLPLSWEYGQAVTDCWEIVRQSPALDVALVVHARWEFGFTNYYCSHCDKKLRKMNKSSLPKYCERCGARMDGDQYE